MDLDIVHCRNVRPVSSLPPFRQPSEWQHQIHVGDCRAVLPRLPAGSVHLVLTSPPYAEARAATYGGISEAEYGAWFLPIAAEMARVLHPQGSLILNLKEGITSQSERSTYVMELILALRQAGWLWREEYIWHKTAVFPGLFGPRLKDGWERLLHFSRERDIRFFPDTVRQPVKTDPRTWWGADWPAGKIQDPITKSGLTVDRHRICQKNPGTALPSNVIMCRPATGHTRHPAQMPETLPRFFVSLMTQENDVVLDPFSGSGTTCEVAARMHRVPVGIELHAEYVRPLPPRPML